MNGPHPAAVTVSWSGAAQGQKTWNTQDNGRLRTEEITVLIGGSVTFVIEAVQADGWVYRPELNEAATTLIVRSSD